MEKRREITGAWHDYIIKDEAQPGNIKHNNTTLYKTQ